MDLLAAEITARTGSDPGRALPGTDRPSSAARSTRALTPPATPEQKAALQKLSPEAVQAAELAGEPIMAKLTRAPGNGAAIGGLKVVTRPAGLRPGRRARRISTKSTPRVSATRPTWMQSSARPRRL